MRVPNTLEKIPTMMLMRWKTRKTSMCLRWGIGENIIAALLIYINIIYKYNIFKLAHSHYTQTQDIFGLVSFSEEIIIYFSRSTINRGQHFKRFFTWEFHGKNWFGQQHSALSSSSFSSSSSPSSSPSSSSSSISRFSVRFGLLTNLLTHRSYNQRWERGLAIRGCPSDLWPKSTGFLNLKRILEKCFNYSRREWRSVNGWGTWGAQWSS